MTVTVNGQPTVIRTSRGLTIAGTRLTIYTILDYLYADWPPKLIRQWFDLTEQQMTDILDYLASHREEVEQEYQEVVERAETLRRYWDKRLQEHLDQQPKKPITTEQAELRAKFEAWKAQRQSA